MSSKVESEKVNVAVWEAAASAVRRLIPERWIVDLVLVALAALLLAATALGALAILSSRAPAAELGGGCLGTCPRHTAESVAFDLWNDPACCEEVR
jgi:hypothetical protein